MKRINKLKLVSIILVLITLFGDSVSIYYNVVRMNNNFLINILTGLCNLALIFVLIELVKEDRRIKLQKFGED
ncbi:hypothetical protein [Anaeromicropila herbilytica]|uniref:Uncharacterized protein n=1 Tax=Anaeromicropila herbilytica TaxID=2785025 RepID=A0A7R7EJX5_9FIRM|nr:hypothetical protein [Anaeromicropila herbilytica]BCN30490.1 hypothetical protein bsdtb5_17850 [Anaeromicropila herbilytica]